MEARPLLRVPAGSELPALGPDLDAGGPPIAAALARAGFPAGTSNRHVAQTLSRKPRRDPGSVPVYLIGPPDKIDATARVSPENRDIARLIDELDKLSDTDLAKKRVEIDKAAHTVGGDEKGTAWKQYEALEFVEGHRNPGKPLRAMPKEKYDVHQRSFMRWVFEEGVRDNGSFALTKSQLKGHSATEADLDFFQRQADAFAREFRGQARTNADRMLNASQLAIEQILSSYGLSAQRAITGVNAMLAGKDLDDAVEMVVNEANESTDRSNQTKFKKQRVELKTQAAELQKLKDLVAQRKRENDVAWTKRGLRDDTDEAKAALLAQERLKDAYRQLKAAWIAAERLQPVLAALRNDQELDKVDLENLGSASVDDRMRVLLRHLLPKLRDIGKAKAQIKSGAIKPMSIPSVVALTRANMFIPKGSLRDGVVNDLQAEAKGADSWLLTVIGVALALITLLPSAGAGLGLAAVGLAAYGAAEEWQVYSQQKTLSNTALTTAQSLWTAEPSLKGFVTSLFMAGLEALPLVAAFRKARAIRRLAEYGDTASLQKLVKELNTVGEEAKAGKLGDQVLDDARAIRKAPHEVHEPHAGPKKQPRAHPHAAGAVKRYADAEEMQWDLLHELGKLDHSPEGPTMAGFRKTLADIDNTENNRKALALYKKAYPSLRDRQAWADYFGKVWQHAADRNMTTVEALEDLVAAGRKPTHVDGELTKVHLAKDEPFIDLAQDGTTHGTHSHMFQEGMLNDRHAGAGTELRKRIANSTGPQWDDNGRMREFYEGFWDGVFDEYWGKQINAPEALQTLLEKYLGFPHKLVP